MLRTVLFVVTIAAATLYYGGLVIVAAALRVKSVPGGWYDRAGRGWSRAILRAAGTPVIVRHAERVPPPPVVFCCNHASMFDIWALAATIPTTVRFVAKKELLKVPLFGRALRAAGHITIDRQNRQAAFDAYEEAALAIRGGLSAAVFPEGTRSRTGELLPFKKGPFVLAIAAQVPIVPVYVSSTYDILPKGRLRLRPKPIVLEYGTPIATAGLTYEERNMLLERTRAAMLELKVRVDGHLAHHYVRAP